MPSLEEIRARLRKPAKRVALPAGRFYTYRYRVDNLESPPLQFEGTIYRIGWWTDTTEEGGGYGFRVNEALVRLSTTEVSQSRSISKLIISKLVTSPANRNDLEKAAGAIAEEILMHRHIYIAMRESDA